MKTASSSIWCCFLRLVIQPVLCLLYLLGVPGSLRAQSGSALPVYFVAQTGAQSNQAVTLANGLNIPLTELEIISGLVSHFDPTGVVNIATQPVTNSLILSNLTVQSPNKFPAIPLTFQAVDLAAVSNLTVLSSNAAVTLFANALANAGLAPQNAQPLVRNAVLELFYTNDNQQVLSVSNALDTDVEYQFSVPAGYPLVGPGAQVQVNFSPSGNVTRLLYSTRQLVPGPMVTLISSATASNRAAAFFPGLNPVINPQLVYYAPPLSMSNVAAILPHYKCGGTGTVTNPATGQVSTFNLMPILIPATDDTTFVPSATLVVNAGGGGTQVFGSVRVSGGTPPYTYQWSGSAMEVQTNTGPSISYTPSTRLTRPTLRVSVVSGPAASGLMISWFDPTGFFSLQSSSNLLSGAWSSVSQPVNTTSDGTSVVLIGTLPTQPTFYRLNASVSAIPKPETVMARITDANGVVVKAVHTLGSVLAIPQIVPKVTLQPHYGWGVESPYDPGLGTQDTQDWVDSMIDPRFGSMMLWNTDWVALNWDYIDALDNPKGCNDYEVDTPDIVLHIGHGDSDEFFFVSPYGQGPLHDNDATDSWGNVELAWLGLLSCNVLQEYDPNHVHAAYRWGQDIDGLHCLMGFTTEAYAETGFPKAFAQHLGLNKWYTSIINAWFAAAKDCGTGTPAVLLPVGPNGVTDLFDYWWGLGSVGPRIRSSQIIGWSYLTIKP